MAGVAVGLLAARVHRRAGAGTGPWVGMCLAAVLSHLVLDCLTSYGVRLFLPFSDQVVSIASIAIIDPFYTLPVAIGVLVALTVGRGRRAGRIANGLGLGIGVAYLLGTLVNNALMHARFEADLAARGVEVERLFVKTTLFNNLLWRGIAETPTDYRVGFRSILDGDRRIELVSYPKDHHLLDGLQDERAVRLLRLVTEDYYRVSAPEGRLRVDDLRFGTAFEWRGDTSTMAFSWELVPAAESGTGRMEIRQLALRPERARDGERLRALLERIAGPSPIAAAPLGRPLEAGPSGRAPASGERSPGPPSGTGF